MTCLCFRWDRNCEKCHEESRSAGVYGDKHTYSPPEWIYIPDTVTARECMLASEKSLAKILDTPEEDIAWKYL